MPASTHEVPPLRPGRPGKINGNAVVRLLGHKAWLVEEAAAVAEGGKVDWRKIADAQNMIFRSSSLKLEAALADLNQMGSQLDSSSIMLGEQHDKDLRSRGPNAFHTALRCRKLTLLTEEMISEQHREVLNKHIYLRFSCIYTCVYRIYIYTYV